MLPSQRLASRATLILAMLGQACVDSAAPPTISPDLVETAARLAQAELDAATQGRTARGFEDEILRLEGRVAGVGGVFADSAGRFVIYMKDSSRGEQARQEFRNASASLQLAAEHRSRLDEEGGIIVRFAKYGFSELLAWQRMLVGYLSVRNGFVAIDADESANRIRITVRDEVSRAVVLGRAAALGIPPDAMVVELGAPLENVWALTATVRPVSGGYQIQHLEYTLTFSCGFRKLWRANSGNSGHLRLGLG